MGPSKGDVEFVEDQKVVDHKSAVSWCLKKWIMDVHGAVQCPGVQPAGMKQSCLLTSALGDVSCSTGFGFCFQKDAGQLERTGGRRE